MIGFVAFTLGPLLFSFAISFFDYPIVGTPQFIGFDNYVQMFTNDPIFWESLGVTFKFAAILVPLNILISLLLALLLHQNVGGSSWYRTIFYLPTVIAGVSLSLIWAWVYDGEYGLLNYILSWFGIEGPRWLSDPEWSLFAIVFAGLWGQGVMMLVFLSGLKNIPKELYEAAEIDGAGVFSKFFSITLPMLSPTMLFNLITAVISAFQQLTFALVITKGGPLRSTYFYAMYVYENAFRYFKMGYSAANAWFMFLIILSLTFVLFKTSKTWVYNENERKGKK
ncbi:carbohydrate ABC transporter permease [Brevibacillus brevis]|uniref:carbohydrate ABC transporter permease n=1 Tax=Brevibacillus brevis TaxID=1393 RepID=UPI0037C9F25D